MKTLLVLAQHPELAETLRGGLSPEHYRIVHRVSVEEAEPLLAHGLVQACILDADITGVQQLWVIEKLRRRSAKIPLIIYSSSKQPEWEEEAYLQGATHILTKPARVRMLNTLLDRLWAAATPPSIPGSDTQELARITHPPQPQPAATLPGLQNTYQSLGALRGFSAILTHSLDAEAMLKQFLLLLRELVGINRAAIFLRHPAHWFGERLTMEDTRRLHAACAIGISPNLLAHFELSFEGGIGGRVCRLGRILRRTSEEARLDVEAQKEFELLGGQVAVPILDRENVVGVAVFDGHITGEPLVNAELELIFHLLEQVGLAIKNIWLHDQLSGNHEMMAEILRELSSACVVVGGDLGILHANKAARRFFGAANQRTGEMEFSDLPQLVGSKVYQVLKTGTGIPTFRFEPEPGTVYNVTIVPFQRQKSVQPASALLMVEDLTQSEQLRRLEIEAANLRLVRTMADRLAHEVGNAMVPLSTHQQLLADKYKDPEFRTSLDAALADGVKRVTRLINQMRFLARDSLLSQEAFPLTPLIEEAYEEARRHQPAKTSKLNYENGSNPIIVTGDRAALKHALTEVILNALQANPADPKIGVKLHADSNGNGIHDLQIEVRDNGTGFSPEAAQKVPSPFFTTRNVGLGLGLTVSRKIIETHHGKLEIMPTKTGQSGVVRISLPIDASIIAKS
jgi:nitrogen-specific signal transduction histidine kinase/DNA-binding NarL/FixJ family response regulator